MHVLKAAPFMSGSPRLDIGQAQNEVLSIGSVNDEIVDHVLSPSQGNRIQDGNKRQRQVEGCRGMVGRGRGRGRCGGIQVEGSQRQVEGK